MGSTCVCPDGTSFGLPLGDRWRPQFSARSGTDVARYLDANYWHALLAFNRRSLPCMWLPTQDGHIAYGLLCPHCSMGRVA
jgi:hypothetical protein